MNLLDYIFILLILIVLARIINGETLYAVYRLYDKDGIDHSGNREFATGYTPDERKARAVAKKLNKAGKS